MPTDLTELCLFLEVCNAVLRIMQTFARLAAPFFKKLWNDRLTSLGALNDQQTQSTNSVKQTLLSRQVLAVSISASHITPDTDACTVPFVFVILQQQGDGATEPIGYRSKSFTAAERKYDTKQRNCLANVLTVLLLFLYLGIFKFSIRSDHDSMKRKLNLTETTCRLAHWRPWLSELKQT